MASRIANVLFLHFWIYVNLAVAQTSSNTKPVAVSEQSKTLCGAWLKASQRQSKDAHRDGLEREPSLQKLLAQPDADLCLLAVVDNQGVVQGVGGDTAYRTALEELGKLNTDRSFNVVTARLHSDALFDRADALEILCRFSLRPETISLLIDSLENDRSPIVKTAAANALRRCQAATAEPAFVRAVERREGAVPIAATGALAEMNSDAGVVPVVSLLLECHDERLLPVLFKALRGYRKKAIIEAMLEKWRSFEYRYEEVQTPADQNASLIMTDCFEATNKLCGPKPENHFREWQAWWMKVEPMLNERLEVAEQYQSPLKDYADSDYGHDPNELELKIAVDQVSFRVGDPIRLDLTFTNKSDKPYRSVLPKPASMMAYGIRLARGDEVILKIEPSDSYVGSYSGPPRFEILNPHVSFRSSVCLQYFLGSRIKQSLPEGKYQLELTFDSSKFAGIFPKGVELTHAWKAEPIQFTIQGEERTDPKEILKLIADKAELPFIASDLKSPIYIRRERAQHAMFQYGDLRLDQGILKLLPPHYLNYLPQQR